MNPLRVCFSCPMARAVFEPNCPGAFGGSEVRAFVFATGLTQQDIEVEVVVDAHGSLSPHRVSGVQLSYRRLPAELRRLREEPSHWRRWSRVPVASAQRLTRSVQKRFASLRSQQPRFDPYLARTAAHVYCAFGVHRHAASVVHTATRLGCPSVLLLASDTDLDESYRFDDRRLNNYGQRADVCRFALRNATWIVAQTTYQQNLLRQRFGRDATVIRNPLPPIAGLPSSAGNAPRADVLWVGRADRFSKRADLAIELARRCGNLQFTFIMNRRDIRVHEQLMSELPGNVRVVERVPWREMHAYFQASALLLNTSTAEGFPNTFLQAAQHGCPIVSLNVDTEGILSQHGAGLLVGPDLEVAARRLTEFAHDTSQRARMAAAAREYVRRYHATELRCAELAAVLRKVAAAGLVDKLRAKVAA